MKYIRKMAQAMPRLSVLAVVWLLSAWEFGAIGYWALLLVDGILLVITGMIAYSNWKWADDERRRERKDKRIARRIIEQTNKEWYLRECA